MTHSKLHLKTNHASKYLQQLGKHFGHKVPATFTSSQGNVTLPFGHCEMTASDSALSITVSGEHDEIGRLEQFISSHLSRFAFRENPTLAWQRAV
ncbi:DUF2218 domain-containing protein [Aliiroseovarius sp. 2305UL8-7]|uniref:DUF2218 domain-containing protein n=1 Tax=Aliiroseovarius conchicola TaxID=3121637 RepID=UPI003528B54D